MVDVLRQNPILLLFIVLAVGYAVGQIKVGGFSLGIAAVLFTGLAAGALDPRLTLPEEVQLLGLVIFVYTIGISSGPGFFRSLRGKGLAENLLAAGVLLFGGGLALGAKALLGLRSTVAAGLFCGAFTSTPALAGTIESVKRAVPPDLAADISAEPVFGYSVAYPMGVIGLLLAFFLFERLWKVSYEEEAARFPDQVGGQKKLLHVTILVTKAEGTEKPLVDLLHEHRWRIILARHKHGSAIDLVSPRTVAEVGDRVTVIGEEKDVRAAVAFLGEESQEELSLDRTILDFRRIFVSNPRLVEKPLRELGIPKKFHAVISRIRRGDVEILPDGNTMLELGDRVRVIAPRDRMAEITRYLGDSYKAVSEIDVIPFGLGIALGLALGSISVPLPGGVEFRLGLAGGPLIVGLLLGRLGRTGPVIWQMPYAANLTLRQLGILLFMAGVGTRSGHVFWTTLKQGDGLLLFAAGAAITVLAVVAALLIGHKRLKIPMSVMMGVVSGLHTQPAALVFASERAKIDGPSLGYAAVYPMATVMKILLAQALLLL